MNLFGICYHHLTFSILCKWRQMGSLWVSTLYTIQVSAPYRRVGTLHILFLWRSLCCTRLASSAQQRAWKHFKFVYLVLHLVCWQLWSLDIQILFTWISTWASICMFWQMSWDPGWDWYITEVFLKLILRQMPLQRNRWLFPVHLSGCIPQRHWLSANMSLHTRTFLVFLADLSWLALNWFALGLLCINASCVESMYVSYKTVERKIKNRVRPRIQSYFTLFLTSNSSKGSPFKLTDAFIPVCKADMSLTKWSGHSSFCIIL